MEELQEQMSPQTMTIPTIQCTIFEDNKGALATANAPKVRPRTKHINVIIHHFRSHVKSGRLQGLAVDTADQLGDILPLVNHSLRQTS